MRCRIDLEQMPVVLVPASKWAMADEVGAQEVIAPAERAAFKGEFLEDLSAVSVAQFVENLKRAYVGGKGKAGSKFQVLSGELTKLLENSPAPGPCTFIGQCMEALVGLEPGYDQGLAHLVTRSLQKLDGSFKPAEDVAYSKTLAAKMFKDAISGEISIDDRVLVRIILVFDVQISDVADAYKPEFTGEPERLKEAKGIIEAFILNLVKERSYNSAVSLLKHFDLQECTTQDFLVTMVSDGQADLAGQWAEYLGRDSCYFLVQQCIDLELYKVAYKLVERYDMHAEFPDAYYLYKRSSLRKLVAKGLWDVAESVAGSDRILQEYLVILALGRKQQNRAAVLCDLFQLEDFDLSAVEVEQVEDVIYDYIQLEDVMPLDKVFWIDNSKDISLVLEHLSMADIVGIDCEWKPNRTKGAESKVSIIQLATKQNVFVLDLHKLSAEAPEVLSHCIKTVFDSSEILKLGYGIGNDLHLLVQSYPDIECFHSCKMLVDLQSFPVKSLTGGLSGLAKSTIGSYLDKSVRMSDWARRPLKREELNYAALDAAILLPIHERLCSAHSITDLGRSHAKSFDFVPQKKSEGVTESFQLLEPAKPEEINEAAVECRNLTPQDTWSQQSAFPDELDQPILRQVKNELQELVIAAGLPLPVYESVSWGPDHIEMFRSTVTVGDRDFHGTPAPKKKDSEFLAAQLALASFVEAPDKDKNAPAFKAKPFYVLPMQKFSLTEHLWGRFLPEEHSSLCSLRCSDAFKSRSFRASFRPSLDHFAVRSVGAAGLKVGIDLVDSCNRMRL